MRTALLVLAIAACGGGTGLDIEIYLPDGAKATRVEVWVAYDPCDDCPSGIAWSDRGPASGSVVFLRDEGVIEAEQQPDRWVLHLDAAPGYADTKAIAFVAFDGDKITAVRVLRSQRIPVTRVEIWKVYLHLADLATTDLVTAPSDPAFDHRAHVWAREPTPTLARPAGCLVYQKWEEGAWATEYFVPKTDPDCDGFGPDKECSEYWFQYKPVGQCVGTDMVRLANTCILGDSPCEDGVTSDKTCGHEIDGVTSCLPDVFCEKCSEAIPADTCVPGVAREAHVANTLPHYDCHFDVTPIGYGCPDQHLSIVLPSGTASCGGPLLHYLDKPFTEPQSALVYGTQPDEATFTAKLSNTMFEPCQVDIYWTGSPKAFASGLLFLLEIQYDNSTRAFYPVEIKPMMSPLTCTQLLTRTCTAAGPSNDRITSCAFAP